MSQEITFFAPALSSSLSTAVPAAPAPAPRAAGPAGVAGCFCVPGARGVFLVRAPPAWVPRGFEGEGSLFPRAGGEKRWGRGGPPRAGARHDDLDVGQFLADHPQRVS